MFASPFELVLRFHCSNLEEKLHPTKVVLRVYWQGVKKKDPKGFQ
jgi:hypothetical protein